MAIDTKQKRMSAMNPGCPWRGPMVDPTETGFNVGNRQAAAFMYSGIAAISEVQYNTICFTAEALGIGSFSLETVVAGSFSSETFATGSFSSEDFARCS